MLFIKLGLIALGAGPAAAFWRLPCKDTLVVERADPIINPGKVSGHVHQILGGNGFDFQMDYNSTQESTCTSCTVKGDFSNYWTPILYFQHQNGSFEKVHQVGGGTVYYLQRAGSREQLHAFPEGFQMIAGDPFKRTGGSDFASQAISYACLDSTASPETGGFPTRNCADGLRAQVFFPSCWDGKNLDSADHKSHMSYPIQAYNSGSCPDTHPVHLISIFYEITFDTNAFKDMWYGSSQPFVWSMGDPTGFGFHGDFINGWDVDLLQKAVDQCTADSGRVEDCPVFNLWPDSAAEGCKLPVQVIEDIQGPLAALPACNPIQSGPAAATPVTSCSATTSISAGASFFEDLTSLGWAYQGCGTDNYYARALTGASTSADDMTNEKCLQFCSGKGFSIAGTEYSRECYCANSIPTAAAPIAGVVGGCDMTCSGDNTEFCGGSGTLSLYQKCTGTSCTNAQIGIVRAGITQASSVSGTTAASSGKTTATVNGSSSKTTSTKPSTTSVANTTKIVPATRPTAASGSSSSATNLPTGWHYKSCVTDHLNPRSLSRLSSLDTNTITPTTCINYCQSQGFTLAGTEYAGECFCGNTLANSTQAAESDCNMPCKGDKSTMCGGPARLSLYTHNSTVSKRHMHDHVRPAIAAKNRRIARGMAGLTF